MAQKTLKTEEIKCRILKRGVRNEILSCKHTAAMAIMQAAMAIMHSVLSLLAHVTVWACPIVCTGRYLN